LAESLLFTPNTGQNASKQMDGVQLYLGRSLQVGRKIKSQAKPLRADTLAAYRTYQNFSRFSSLSVKIGLILCFGKSRAFQSAKPNVLFPFSTLYSY
jgi:hypothetical protein